MLLEISKKRSAGAPALYATRATALLGECHERIRHFSALAIRLATAEGAAPAEITETCGSLIRYFGQGLPLHEADEERSVTPALEAAGAAPALHAALVRMEAEHRAIHRELDRLMRTWQILTHSPDKLPRHTHALEVGSRRLDALFEVHLALEEERVFPAIEALPPSARAHLAQEIVARHRL